MKTRHYVISNCVDTAFTSQLELFISVPGDWKPWHKAQNRKLTSYNHRCSITLEGKFNLRTQHIALRVPQPKSSKKGRYTDIRNDKKLNKYNNK